MTTSKLNGGNMTNYNFKNIGVLNSMIFTRNSHGEQHPGGDVAYVIYVTNGEGTIRAQEH